MGLVDPSGRPVASEPSKEGMSEAEVALEETMLKLAESEAALAALRAVVEETYWKVQLINSPWAQDLTKLLQSVLHREVGKRALDQFAFMEVEAYALRQCLVLIQERLVSSSPKMKAVIETTLSGAAGTQFEGELVNAKLTLDQTIAEKQNLWDENQRLVKRIEELEKAQALVKP